MGRSCFLCGVGAEFRVEVVLVWSGAVLLDGFACTECSDRVCEGLDDLVEDSGDCVVWLSLL